ncbi:hypothetical protein BO221_14800 [Archangium sp. Cb G35]|uniref:hypothetical protein n=1 Tax=Archangium sp. Cb G35 TaxID=1920190 RepID=UPI000937F0C7|nr:hypothetical protein [Archangium sp. Cb G35]OJT24424.1 hypothetical protein BO221_14800 [Archangium sp. Cb G35]
MRKYLCAFLLLGVSACGPEGSIFDDIIHDASKVHGPGTYRLSDSGVRCAQAPCPTLRVSSVSSNTEFLVSEIEFPAGMPQNTRQQATALISTPDGLAVYGAPRGKGDARVFVVQSLLER